MCRASREGWATPSAQEWQPPAAGQINPALRPCWRQPIAGRISWKYSWLLTLMCGLVQRIQLRGNKGLGQFFGHPALAPHGCLEAVDVGQHLCHSGVKRGWDGLVQLGMGVERTCKNGGFKDRNVVAFGEFADLQRDQV